MTLTHDQREIAIGLLIEKSHCNMEQTVKMPDLIIGIWLQIGFIIHYFMLLLL